jgi:hypothetical protein
MRKLFFLIALLAGCATTPPEREGVQITVTVEEAEACKKAGGCGLLSMAQVAEIQNSAFQLGARQAVKQIEAMTDSHGCRRDLT